MPHCASFGSSSVTYTQNIPRTLIPHALIVHKTVRNDLPNHGQLVWTGCGLMVLVRPRNRSHGIDLRAIMPHCASFDSSSVTDTQNIPRTLIPHALIVHKIVRNDLPNHGQLVWTGCGLMVLVRPRNRSESHYAALRVFWQ